MDSARENAQALQERLAGLNVENDNGNDNDNNRIEEFEVSPEYLDEAGVPLYTLSHYATFV